MSEKDVIFQGKIKQSGIFTFKDFYSFSYDWLRDQGFDVSEKVYSEKVAGDSKDIDIEWEATKKVSDYFQFYVKLAWKILGMKSVEVQRDGKKIKTNSGVLEIKFKSVLVKDYESRWEDRPLWKFLRGVYDRYIVRSRIESYEDKLFGETDDLIAQLKAYLTIEGQK